MFWRTSKKMEPTNSNNWPRNGTLLKGTWEKDEKGDHWAHFENGFFLPLKQKGYTILFDMGPA
jgi:hypothetical protein